VLGAADIARLRRFGEAQHFEAENHLIRAGEIAPGLIVIFSGEVRVVPREEPDKPIVTYGPGSFMGELAQLSGRPALANAITLSPVEALVIPPARLRELMVQEAELGELIMRALILRRMGLLERGVGPVIIGHAGNRDVLRLEGFLRRNGHPYQRLDPDVDEAARALLEKFHLSAFDLPTVLCLSGEMVRNPSEAQLARCLGLTHALDPERIYDVAIIGAGPAGLAAGVYATSEGLSVVIVDCRAFGGQAGASARIENYLGFPTGISGMALMGRAYSQAQKFGAEIVVPEEAIRLDEKIVNGQRYSTLSLLSGQTVAARTVVIACGAEYRRLDVANLADYEGSHVHYWASPIEARLCAGEEVALVGGGNSAGQAAVYLASAVRKVWMIVRGTSLAATMSRYLCDRIAAQPNIEVCLETEVVRLDGSGGKLDGISWRRAAGEDMTRAVRHLFLLIGAVPNTRWLAQSGIKLDGKGFVEAAAFAENGRNPFETSRAGVFAIGDIRSQSVKRVAASVGEGAQVVAAIHAYLAEHG
jgi:thioredoxin reductase (NADPH)